MTDSDNDTRFIYKCRNCGVRFQDPRVTDVTHAKWHLNSLVHDGQGIDIGYGVSPKLIEVHDCSEVERGLADLIGIGREENK